MKTRKGLTIIEIIIALALIGIIAAGIIPIFGLQFKMLVDTKDITIGAFDAQGAIETSIVEDKKTIVSSGGAGLTKKTFYNIWGKDVQMYELIDKFPSNEKKSIYVYLSGLLANMQDSTDLIASNVYIEVDGTSSNPEDTANMTNSPAPVLTANCDIFHTPTTWVTNIYMWYKSKPGNTDPKFPYDYELHERKTNNGPTQTLIDTSGLINRYVVVTVTPVDINGVRGKEQTSSNRVLILGQEWRTGVVAWVDKNLDSTYTDANDIKVSKPTNLTWALLKSFDSLNQFQDPLIPANNLDPSGGSLFVPMRVQPLNYAIPAQTFSIGEILVDAANILDWTIDKSINIATNIKVSNSSDIDIKSRDGNITLWQFVKMATTGNDAEYETTGPNSGRAKLITNGASLVTTKDINLNSGISLHKQGDIVLQNYATLYGRNINLTAKGHIYLMGNNTVQADNGISLDSTYASNETGNRDISITNSNLTIKNGVPTNTKIDISSRNLLNISAVNFNGNQTTGDSDLILSANEGVNLINSNIYNLNTYFQNDVDMVGGSWTTGKTVMVKDSKSLTFEASGPNKVNNGNLILGNTGEVNFKTSMTADITNPLTITLSKGSLNNQVLISNNYGRNMGYADSKLADSFVSLGSYQNLGANQYNLEYEASKVSGYGNVTGLSVDFDGTNSIKINATTTGEVSANYELLVRDKFADNAVVGMIKFKIVALDMGLPTVTIGGQTVPTYVVTFDKNGGDNNIVPPSATVVDSEPLSMLPTPPTRAHYNFLGWNTKADGTGSDITTATHIFGNLTAYAQWTQIPVYQVIFDQNGGTSVGFPITLPAERGTSLGSLPTPPTPAVGYRFASWNTIKGGSGSTFTATTIINASITVYAQYTLIPMCKVTFYINDGSTESNPAYINYEQGTLVVNLPTPPTRTGYAFLSWNTLKTGSGTTFGMSSTVPSSSALSVYAKWLAYKYYSQINTGEYVAIANKTSQMILFQKIDGTRLLARSTIGNKDWATAVTNGASYKTNNFSQNWILSSALLDNIAAGNLDKNSIRNISAKWWLLEQANPTTTAYYVLANGNTGNQAKTNLNGIRPCITVAPANLVVDTGTGTSLDPYILKLI